MAVTVDGLRMRDGVLSSITTPRTLADDVRECRLGNCMVR